MKRYLSFSLTILCWLCLTSLVWGEESVKIHLKWLHQFQSAGYLVALEKGYYAAEGLQVTLIEGGPNRPPIKRLLKGEVQYAVADSGAMLYRAQGQPIVVLANIFQHSPQVLITRDDVQRLEDLRGKRVMLQHGFLTIEAIAMLKKHGIDMHNGGALRQPIGSLDDLIQGRTDAWPGYSTNEPFLLKQKNIPFHMFYPRHDGIDFYGDMLVTTQSELDEHEERAEKILKATLKGWNDALQHPKEAVNIIYQHYNTQHKSREHLLFEAHEISHLMLGGVVKVGYINIDRWKNIAQTYEAFNLLPHDFKLDGFLYQPKPQLEEFVENYVWQLSVLLFMFLAAFFALHWWIQRDTVLKKTNELMMTNAHLLKAKQDAESALASKSEFLSVMSHELRTPLHGMIGLLDLMRPDISLNKQADFDLIQQSAQSLQALINDVLDLSKVDAGKLKLKYQEFDVKACVLDVLRTFVVAIRDKNITLTAELEAVPTRMQGDEVRVRQVLVNLVGNAVKFTEKGGVHIHLKGLQEKDKTWLDVRVSDTGVGIAAQDLESIFEPFTQMNTLMECEYRGTGLGTTIAKRLVKEMHGDIRVSSEVGKGSTFNFRIPCHFKSKVISCVLSTQDTARSFDETQQAFLASTQNGALPECKILLAEDDPISQKIALKRLKKSGVDVDLAKDGLEAWHQFKHHTYQVILLDLRMPGMDGLTLTRKIRQWEQEKGEEACCIVGLSAHALEDVQKSCLDAGMDTFLSKPIEPKSLVLHIQKFLKENSA